MAAPGGPPHGARFLVAQAGIAHACVHGKDGGKNGTNRFRRCLGAWAWTWNEAYFRAVNAFAVRHASVMKGSRKEGVSVHGPVASLRLPRNHRSRRPRRKLVASGALAFCILATVVAMGVPEERHTHLAIARMAQCDRQRRGGCRDWPQDVALATPASWSSGSTEGGDHFVLGGLSDFEVEATAPWTWSPPSCRGPKGAGHFLAHGRAPCAPPLRPMSGLQGGHCDGCSG